MTVALESGSTLIGGGRQSGARLAMSSSLAVHVTFILRRWSRYESTSIYDFGLDEIDAMLRQ